MKYLTCMIFLLISFYHNAFAGLHQCVISRNGNEFWFNHHPGKEQVCDTTVRLKKINSHGEFKNIEFRFLTQRNSQSTVMLSIGNEKPIQLLITGRLTIDLSSLTAFNETILFLCEDRQVDSPSHQCDGLRSYPLDPRNDGPIKNVDGLVEDLP